MKIKMNQQYRILQIRAIYKTGIKSGVKLDVIVSNLEEFKVNMLKLTGADQVDITYESVDENEYIEEEDVMI
jgi:hypothetical protein